MTKQIDYSEDYGQWYEMQIEAWAERRNEATLAGTDDYPTRPVYRFPSQIVSVEAENEKEKAEYLQDLANCPF